MRRGEGERERGREMTITLSDAMSGYSICSRCSLSFESTGAIDVTNSYGNY
jgi:hypothetical protein